NYNGGKITFRLTGRGIVPSFSCVPAVVDFGKVERDQTETLQVACTNNTELPTALSAGPMQGDHKSLFNYTLAQDVKVPARGTINIPVTFQDTSGSDGRRNA